MTIVENLVLLYNPFFSLTTTIVRIYPFKEWLKIVIRNELYYFFVSESIPRYKYLVRLSIIRGNKYNANAKKM
ncbi:28450_t:CDS:2 [Gigaspora margarita]|uniref:28450_t:CDS:1 n=1 Tax=Gigaspora margarita TaxID=4874 RepID=A0ABN7UK84_GIGMA|nr:28450_t:CDS:2 [Gigaspora margarita]